MATTKRPNTMPTTIAPERAASRRAPRRGAQPLATPEALPEDLPERDALDGDRFWQPALAILVLGIVLRQLWLDRFPYHPDEAIHAWFPLDLNNYKPNPVYHGPVMYYLTAFTYSLFGGLFKWLHIDIRPDNDYTGRLAPSLLGIGLLAIVIFGPLRRWMGARAVLWSAALLAISPSVVTYSRRTLHDALVLVLTLGALLFFQQARQSPAWSERGYAKWLGLSCVMALFLATKANVFFLAALLVAFWAATWVQARVESLPSLLALRDWASKYLTWLPLALFAIVTAASYFTLRYTDDAEHTASNEKMFSLCVVACAGLLWAWIALAPRHAVTDASTWDSIERDDEQAVRELRDEPEVAPRERRTRTWRSVLLSMWSGILVFAWFCGHGYLWWKVPVEMVSQPRAWAAKTSASFKQIRDAAAGRPIETEMLEASLTPLHILGRDVEMTQRMKVAQDWDDITMSVPRMVAYWSNQQKNPRLPGRHDYYVTLILLYEFPIALAAIGGIWYASKHRSSWGDLLLWWAFLSWALYAVANEKVPWLLVHLILPFSLLGGWWLSRLWTSWSERERSELPALGILCGLGAIFLLRNTSATNFERAAVHREPMFYAQTSEDFRDEMMRGLVRSAVKSGGVWLHNDKQWPGAWYFRTKSPLLAGSALSFGAGRPADPNLDRLLITTPEDWAELKKKPEWNGWTGVETTHYIWPRASWPALAPGRWLLWWLDREGVPLDEQKKPYSQWHKSILSPAAGKYTPDGTETPESKYLPGGEWSDSKAVFVTPPQK